MRLLAISREQFEKDDEVIIYGAGLWGEIAYYGMELLDIPVSYFCDRMLKGTKKCEKNVYGIEKLEYAANKKIVIASQNYFKEMVDHLKDIGYEECYNISTFFDLPLDVNKLSNDARGMYENPERYLDQIEYYYMNQDDLYISHLEIVVTERCTLKCRYCATFSPYYENAKNIEYSECKKAVEKFLDCVEYISEVRLLGGEPFVNAHIGDYIDALANNKKIGVIHIYTNGTVIPKKEILCKLTNQKVHIHISNYIHNEDKIKRLIEIFEEWKITYTERKYDFWVDMGRIEKHDYSAEERKMLFQNCLAKTCYTILRDKLFRCSRAANIYNMGYKKISSQYVELDNDESTEKVREQIKHLLFETEELDACDYCLGMDMYHNKVNVAEQLQ